MKALELLENAQEMTLTREKGSGHGEKGARKKGGTQGPAEPGPCASKGGEQMGEGQQSQNDRMREHAKYRKQRPEPFQFPPPQYEVAGTKSLN